MTVELSETAANAMLNALGLLLDDGRIELSSRDRVVAVLQLSNPATRLAMNGEMAFYDIAEEDSALGQGDAISATVLAADGSEIFSCDVGDENSDAVIKLNTTKIYRGSPVRLKSFRLVMP